MVLAPTLNPNPGNSRSLQKTRPFSGNGSFSTVVFVNLIVFINLILTGYKKDLEKSRIKMENLLIKETLLTVMRI
jgi:hypothetical protein